jgi:hypothetical protein
MAAPGRHGGESRSWYENPSGFAHGGSSPPARTILIFSPPVTGGEHSQASPSPFGTITSSIRASSIGKGKTIVELFSPAITFSVLR